MFDYLKGKLTRSSPTQVTLEIQGMGYLLFIPLSHYSKLPSLGEETLLYVSTVIREDSHKHYGFLTFAERDLFEKLNEISGIGPKTALALIGHIDLSTFQLAIHQENVTLFSKVPGIGKKTAERLMIEMRDKIKLFDSLSLEPFSSGPQKNSHISDAINALIHLGYPPLQAQKAIKAAMKGSTDEIPLGELITVALRHI